MHPILEKLLAGGPVLTDGAWGTQMQARGLAVGEFPDAWNLEHPAKVREVARAYVDAGSQVILTNTFGSNRVRLAESALAAQLKELNVAGVAISREAAGTDALVFASMGPTGKMLMTGEVSEDEMTAAYTEQASALVAAGADALVLETMADLAEACLAIRAVKPFRLPVVACLVFDSGRAKDRTMMGNTPEQAAKALSEAGADVIGANCGQGIEGFVTIAERLRAATDRPLWIKANAGLPEMIDDKVVYRTTPTEFAAVVPRLRDAGVSFLGGCCGTSPDFVRAVATVLRS